MLFFLCFVESKRGIEEWIFFFIFGLVGCGVEGKWVFLVFPRKMQFSFYLVLFSYFFACLLASLPSFDIVKKKKVWKHYFYYISKRNKYENIFATSTWSTRFLYFNISCTFSIYNFNILPFFLGKKRKMKREI